MGGDNFFWDGTPLIQIYNKHVDQNSSNPIREAAIDAGWILKKVIHDDKRQFIVKREEMTNKYLWIEEED